MRRQTATILAIAGGAAPLANLYVVAAGRGRSYEGPSEAPKRAVAIVLGARVWPDGRPSVALEDRLRGGLELFEAGRVRHLLVSGSAPEVGPMTGWLRARGVPAEAIRADPQGLRTRATMQRAAEVFGVDSAVLCTQRYHLARALFLADEAGIDAVGLVCDRRRYQRAARDQLREVVARTAAVVDVLMARGRGRGRTRERTGR